MEYYQSIHCAGGIMHGKLINSGIIGPSLRLTSFTPDVIAAKPVVRKQAWEMLLSPGTDQILGAVVGSPKYPRLTHLALSFLLLW